MKKYSIIAGMTILIMIMLSFSTESLRSIYSRPPGEWPKPFIDDGIEWKELGVIPNSPLDPLPDSLNQVVALGKILFFDTRLSGSGKISCASCHDPALHWTDGKERSVGHEGTLTKRNSPTILNTWFYSKLFWDGRARDLEDQAFAPINSETEMHNEMPDLVRSLRKIPAYQELFQKAFGTEGIDPDRLASAMARFERTLVSRKSRFDEFLSGNKKALNQTELKGLHIFRTKARCMNCHHGTLFSDNLFHNNGFSFSEKDFTDSASLDMGRYNVTHKEDDMGKFKTPSLRDVRYTGPWMHDGRMKTLADVLAHYNKGAAGNRGSDITVKTLALSRKELKALEAFLGAISALPPVFTKPDIPR